MSNIVQSSEDDGRNDYMQQWLDAHASAPIANDVPSRDTKDKEGFVGRLYGLCLRELRDFHHQQRGISKSRSNVLRECLGRLYLWGEPFGSGDLDKALGQSDELRDNVLESLVHIGKLLLRKSTSPPKAPQQQPSKQITGSKSIIEQGRDNVLEGLVHIGKLLRRKSIPSTPSPEASHQPSEQITELESIVKQGKLLISGRQDEVQHNSDENGEEYDSESGDSSDIGSYDTIEDISFATTCLMELGPSLEQELQHAETARNQSSHLTRVPFAVSLPAMSYIKLIREKFEQADYNLVERLGEANWQRHRDVRDKIEKTELSPQERTKLGGEASITCSIFRPYSDFHDSGIRTSVPAQTEYAPSHTSFLSSKPEGHQVSLRVPKEPPEVAAGNPFQCFLCRCVISNVRNRIDWKMHVFADLRPYICTFPNCKDELAQFTTRAAWADHERTEHRYDMMWNCPECSEKFAGASDWEQHLHEMHQHIFTESQLHWARKTAYQIYQRPAEIEECPLCRVVLGKPRRTFVKHVTRHMEEIALMALPSSIGEDSDGSSDSTGQVSTVAENPELQATNTVDLPPDTRKDSDEGSEISMITLKDYFDFQLDPVESAAEADRGTKLQPVKSAAKTSEEEKLQSNKNAAKAVAERTLQPVKSAAAASGKRELFRPPRPPRPPPPKEFWICGDCGEGGMSIVYSSHCSACGRRKDLSAREY